MPHISRFKKRDSDRSGFTYLERELVKQGPWKLGGDEWDQPPPSRRSLGGEGEISGEARVADFTIANLTTTSESTNPLRYITAAGGITPETTFPYMVVVGSNANITITANPQIARGQQGQILTLQGAGSSITLTNGNGVATTGSVPFVLTSGAVITLIYQTGGTVWQEASRNPFGRA